MQKWHYTTLGIVVRSIVIPRLSNIQRSIQGPHHCASMGNSLQRLIFSLLRTEMIRSGGQLNEEDLQKLEKNLESADGQMSQYYAKTYNNCMSTLPGANAPSFSNDEPFKFYLDLRLRKLLPEFFPMPNKVDQDQRHKIFRNALTIFIRDEVGEDVIDRVKKAYFELAIATETAMTMDHLINDHRGVSIVNRALASLSYKCSKDPKMMQRFIELVNHQTNAKGHSDNLKNIVVGQ